MNVEHSWCPFGVKEHMDVGVNNDIEGCDLNQCQRPVAGNVDFCLLKWSWTIASLLFSHRWILCSVNTPNYVGVVSPL